MASNLSAGKSSNNDAAQQLITEGIGLFNKRKLSLAAEKLGLARDAAVSAGNRLLQARALGNLANVHAMQFDHSAAVTAYQQALSMFREIGDVKKEAVLLGNLAMSLAKINRNREAEEAMARKAALCKDIDPAAAREAKAWIETSQRERASRRASVSSAGGSSERKHAGGEGVVDTAGQLMEFSFDNLRFSDVLERADFSLKRVDTVLDFIKGRAAAEKGYAKSIKELGTVHSGLLKNFEGLWGNKSPSSEPTDRSTLEAAIDATRDNMKQTAALREARVAGLEALAARLVDLRSRHQTSVKALTSLAQAATKQVKVVGRQLSKASARLEKARNNENKCFRRASLLDPSDPKRKKAMDTLAAARGEVDAAEDSLRSTATKLVSARNDRDNVLADVAEQMEELELERLNTLAHVLQLMTEQSAAGMTAEFTAHAKAQKAVAEAEPMTDMRMFVHKRRVHHMLVHKQKQLEQAAEKARRRAAEDAAAETGAPVPPVKSGKVISDADDDGLGVVPRSLAVTARKTQTTAHMRKMEELGPRVAQWVVALFNGTGKEVRSALTSNAEDAASTHGAGAGAGAGSGAGAAADASGGDGDAADAGGDGDDDASGDASADGDGDAAADGDGDAAASADGDGDGDAETGDKAGPANSTGDGADGDGADAGSGNDVEGGELTFDVDGIFSSLAGRMLFLRELNQQRTKKQDVGEGYERLAGVMSIFLDYCHAVHDVDSAKMMMIMSETFYRPQPELNADASAEGSSGPARQFIQTALVGHKMWRSLSFWEEAFYRSIREEVKKTYGRQLAASGGADGAVPVALQPGSREWQYMYQQIVFGQLGSYAMNMRAFGVAEEAVDRVVQRLGHGNGLSEDYLQVLFSNAEAQKRSEPGQ